MESRAHSNSHTTPRVAHVVRFAVVNIIYRARSAVGVILFVVLRVGSACITRLSFTRVRSLCSGVRITVFAIIARGHSSGV